MPHPILQDIPSLFVPFWEEYLATVTDPDQVRARYYETCRFGHTEDNATKTAALVVAGEKTATSTLLAEFEMAGKPLPEPGSLTIVVDGRARAAAIIETTHVEVVAFDAVGAEFVHDYGEGDRSLDFWRQTMWGYYAEECDRLGLPASPDMLLVCEYFRVVHAPGETSIH